MKRRKCYVDVLCTNSAYVVNSQQDKVACSVIRKRTKRIDIIEYTLKHKWKWVGCIARMDQIDGPNAAQSGNQ